MANFDIVILAGGKGKRLSPITDDTPKSMIRILQKPLLEWLSEGAVENLTEIGKIILVVGSGKNEIISHFSSLPYSKKIVFAEQKEPLGTADALFSAESFVSSDNFLVLNGDTFSAPSFFTFLKPLIEKKEPFIVGKRVPSGKNYGVLDADQSGSLKRIIEKPSSDSENALISTGCFFLPKTFFPLLKKISKSERGEFEVTDALSLFASESKLKVMEFSGFWSDIGYFWNYLDASSYAVENLMKEKREGTVEERVSIKGKLFLGENSVIKSGTYIEGNAFIGKNCIIGPNAYLRGNVCIEDNCHVGNSTEVKNSIVLKNSNAAHLSYLGDSVICEDVNFGAGTKIANLKFDNSEISVEIDGKKTNSGRKKLGAVIGKGTKTGINSSINCGSLIGGNCRILPNAFVSGNLKSCSIFSGKD